MARADIALGGGLAALVLGLSVLGVGPEGPTGPLDWGAVALAVAMGAVLVLRRRNPWSVLLVTNAITLAWFAFDYHGRLVTVAPLIACYTLAAHRGWRAGVGGALVTAVVTVVAVRSAMGGTWFDDQVVNAIPLEAAATALGAAVHSHRAFRAGARERAERIAEARSEQAKQQAKAQAAEERLEIARELHDVFGHTMAAISVQAGVAVHVMERKPEQAAEALRAIKKISDDGLAEVRVLLGVMRSENVRALTASGGLARLDELLGVPGVEVELTVEGEDRAVPLAVDLAAFRIIQESLTNVRRHAGASKVWLTLSYGDSLEVVVRDDGSLSPVVRSIRAAAVGGHGIEGMRARARALGGELSAGRVADGFEVRCRLPTREAR